MRRVGLLERTAQPTAGRVMQQWVALGCWLLAAPLLAAPVDQSMSLPGENGIFVPRSATQQAHADNLYLTSTLVRGGAPYPGTQFSVLRPEPDAYGKTRLTLMANSGPHSEASFRLSPGPYLVRASNGAVTREERIEIPFGGALHHTIVLDAAEFHLSSVMSNEGAEAEQTWFKIFRTEPDAYGRPELIQVAGKGYGSDFAFLLPEGEYLAEATFGHSRVESQIEVTAGLPGHHVFNLNAGRLTLSARTGKEGEPIDTRFAIFPRSSGMPAGARQEIARANGASPITFVMPRGEYLVRAESGGAHREQAVSISAGGDDTVEMTLNVGEALLYATFGNDPEPLPGSRFRVIPLDDAAAIKLFEFGPGGRTLARLPAGRYLVLAFQGDASGRAEIDILAGEISESPIPLNAGRVRLRLDTAEGDAPLTRSWFSIYRVEQLEQGVRRIQVFNGAYSNQVETLLPPGDYIAFARQADVRGEQAFSLVSGETRDVAIATER